MKKRAKDWPCCGAKTRKGTPCKAHPVMDKKFNEPRNGRCKNHGGMSLGRSQPQQRADAAAKKRAAHLAKHQAWLAEIEAKRTAESLARKKATDARRNKRKRDIRAMKKSWATLPEGTLREDGVMEY